MQLKKMLSFDNVPRHILESLDWLLTIEDFQTARSLAHTVFKYLPKEDPRSSDFLGYVLFTAKFYKEAAKAAQKTLQLIPDSPDAKFNAAKCLNSAGDPWSAEKLMEQAIASRPGWMDGEIEIAVFVSLQGRHDEAMERLKSIFPKLTSHDKNKEIVQYNLGWHDIRHGNFKGGMKRLNIGRKLKIWGTPHRDMRPMLQPGMSLKGKTVLIRGEAGAGDEIIGARFGQTIVDRGGKAIWISRAPLCSLLTRTPCLSSVVLPDEAGFPRYDYWAPCMDLPMLLDVDLHEIPNQTYIFPDPKYVKKWKNKLLDSGKMKIGVRWQGNALYEQDLMRGVPFTYFEKLAAAMPGVDFYSLQRDDGADERPSHSPIVDWGRDLETWEDTAGAIANLDLVISSCTSVPHLSAAMGKPTWVLCPLNCYYIWATPGDTSPWYPTVRLFRQQTLHSWDVAFERIHNELSMLSRNPGPEAHSPQIYLGLQ